MNAPRRMQGDGAVTLLVLTHAERRELASLIGNHQELLEGIIDCVTVPGTNEAMPENEIEYRELKRARRLNAACERWQRKLEPPADEPSANVAHSSWVWNRRIIERIRAVVPNPPVLDEDLVAAVERLVSKLAAAQALLGFTYQAFVRDAIDERPESTDAR